MMTKRELFSITLALCGIFFASTPHAEVAGADSDSQAVLAPNASIDLSGGSIDGDGNAGISSVVSIPAGKNWGIQVDSLYSRTASEDGGGLGGHYFYRNPESFLLGGTAMWYHNGRSDVFRYGLESEIYLSDVTIAPSLGVQNNSHSNNTAAFYGMDISYYPTDNLKFTVSGSDHSDLLAAYGNVEWQALPSRPLTVFATGGSNDSSDAVALVGMRYSFGSDDKSLKYRDRHCDPKNIVNTFDVFSGTSVHNSSDSVHTAPPTCCSCVGGSSVDSLDMGIGIACCPCS